MLFRSGKVKVVKKRAPPLWTGVQKTSGNKVYITIRKDHHMLMSVYENSRQILSNRIDVCGATADLQTGGRDRARAPQGAYR